MKRSAIAASLEQSNRGLTPLEKFEMRDVQQFEKDREAVIKNSDEVLFVEVSTQSCDGFFIPSPGVPDLYSKTHYVCYVQHTSRHPSVSAYIVSNEQKKFEGHIVRAFSSFIAYRKMEGPWPKVFHISYPYESREILFNLCMLVKYSSFEEVRVSPFKDAYNSEDMDKYNYEIQNDAENVSHLTIDILSNLIRGRLPSNSKVGTLPPKTHLENGGFDISSFLKDDTIIKCYGHFRIRKSNSYAGFDLHAKVFAERDFVPICESLVLSVDV